MKKRSEKDRKKRYTFLKHEPSRKVLKAISQNLNLPLDLRSKAFLSLSALPKSSSPTQVKKRCLLSGRGRFLIGNYNLSRMAFRQLARSGLIPGLRKSSW